MASNSYNNTTKDNIEFQKELHKNIDEYINNIKELD